MNIQTPDKFSKQLVPLQLLTSGYGHAALLDSDDNELPITEHMILTACEEAMDLLYSFLPGNIRDNHKIQK